MGQKYKTILSSISLAFTSFLLIMVLFAWYATNKQASVTGGNGRTAGIDYSLDLERGIYNPEDSNADSKGIVWSETKNMAFSNVSPGNVFYFRIKIVGESSSSYKTSFGDVSSALVENKLKVVSNSVCLNDGFNTKLYTVSSGKVMVDSKTLYSISGSTISLGDYQIHDVFYVYDYGTSEMTPTAESKVTGTGVPISTFQSTAYTITSETKYYYFALEFNEADSLVSFPDGTSSSNCYLYQKIYIGHISVDEQK